MRTILPKDSEAIRNLYRVGALADGLAPQYVDRTLEGDLKDPFATYGTGMWLIEEDGVAVGMIGVMDTEIRRLMVHPDHRRKGHGRMLLAMALSTRGKWLECIGSNKAACALYEKSMKVDSFEELVSRTSGVHYVLVRYVVE